MKSDLKCSNPWSKKQFMADTCVSSVLVFWKSTERLANWGYRPNTQPTTGGFLFLASLEKHMPSALKKDPAKWLKQSWMIPSAVFVPAVALQTKFSLSSKFSRNLECAKDDHTCFVDFEKAHHRVSPVKLWGMLREYGIDNRLLLTSSNCIPVRKFVSVPREINHNRSPLVLDSDKGVCCHHSSSKSTWIG